MRLTPIDFAIPKVRLTQEEILADLLYPAEPALATLPPAGAESRPAPPPARAAELAAAELSAGARERLAA